MNKPSVLIVESNEWLGEQYERVLRSKYKTTLAQNAVVAMEIIDNIMPDVILLDILLTGSTAFTLLHELQSYGDTGAIPVIVCTSMTNEFSIEMLKPYGVKLMLDKTMITPADLGNAVEKVLL